MAKILIAEDDEFFRAAIRSILEDAKHSVIEAPDGRAARQILMTTNVDIILSDVQMPYFGGIELLQWNSENKNIPFILMTGFSHILETQNAYELGAKEFLSKPFEDKELIQAVNSIIGPPPEAEGEKEKEHVVEYCKVSLSEFVGGKELSSDVFVQLSPTKTVLIGRTGDSIPTERIENYNKKGLKHLYVRREDFSKLVKFNLALAKVVQASGAVSVEKKKNFLRYTGEMILEHAFVEGVNKESFEEARDFLNTSIEVLAGNENAVTLLDHLNSHGDFLYAHSLCVSMYAAMIARKMGYESSQVFFKISMGGLYHDIGKKEISREILEKPRPLLTYEERALIETHPHRGREILMLISGIPEDVIEIAYQHHENILGSGYPHGLKKEQIHPLAHIVSTANVFARYAIKSSHHPGMDGKSAIREMEMRMSGTLEPKSFLALKSIFGL